VVNGPGEARDADLGIAAGRKRGHLFVKGKVVKVVPEDEMVGTLVEWAELIMEGGVEAALARADSSAEGEAEADRQALLQDQGADANSSEQKVDLIRRTVKGSD
jgi:(E)-4-hydroxy-3-methylbut-2-enyl-diphosphate synthase